MAAPATPASRLGSTVGIGSSAFKLDRVLGAGGFGAAYSATCVASGSGLTVGSEYCVKLTVGSDISNTAAVELATREAQALKDVSHHPHIVRYLESTLQFESEKLNTWVVMDLLKGSDLAEIIDASSTSSAVAHAREIALGITKGLKHLHEARVPIIHRDLKPQNIMVTRGGRHPTIIDFGAAAFVAGTHTSKPDLDGHAGSQRYDPGSPAYFSLERMTGITGSGPPVGRSDDMFALGVMMFELLAGQHFYEAVPGVIPCRYLRDMGPSAMDDLVDRFRSRDALLTDVCKALLKPETSASRRPSAGDVFMRFAAGAAVPRAPAGTAMPSAPPETRPMAARAPARGPPSDRWSSSGLPGLSSDGVSADNAGTLLTLAGSSKPKAVFGAAMRGSGTYTWDVEVQEDKRGDETGCVGIACEESDMSQAWRSISPVVWIRHFNGSITTEGCRPGPKTSLDAIHAGTTVRFALNLDDNTLQAQIVSGSSRLETVATGLPPGKTWYVVAARYSTSTSSPSNVWLMSKSPTRVRVVGADGGGSSEHFTVGDVVRLKARVTSPKYGAAGVTRADTGTIIRVRGDVVDVKFPDVHSDWSADPTELRRSTLPVGRMARCRQFRRGGQGRIKPSVSAPRGGWKGLRHGDVFTVEDLDEDGDLVVTVKGCGGRVYIHPEDAMPSDDEAGRRHAFKVGDRVRPKSGLTSPRFGWGSASQSDTGEVVDISTSDVMRLSVRISGSTSAWHADDLRPADDSGRTSGAFAVGDRVRFKTSVTKPKFRWRGASHGSVGRVTRIDGDGDLRVEVPGLASGREVIMSPADAEKTTADLGHRHSFRVGDLARLRDASMSPAFGWPSGADKAKVRRVTGMSGSLNPQMTVGSTPGYNVKASDLVKVASDGSGGFLVVGDRVRIKESVSRPRYRWATGLGPCCVGEIIDVDHDGDPVVRFDGVADAQRWAVHASELEKTSKPLGCMHSFRVGDTVTVRSASYGWGKVTAGDRGEVIGFDSDWDVLVSVPSRGVGRWVGKPGDFTANGDSAGTGTSSGTIAVGDSVRVRDSVTKPKYGWKGASHGSVGRVVSIDSDGDFRVEFSGIRSPSRLILTPSEAEKTTLSVGHHHGFRTGHTVRVRTGRGLRAASSGGTPSVGDRGTIRSIRDVKRITVRLDSGAEWVPDAGQIELVTVLGDGNVCVVGDCVHLDPSVRRPRKPPRGGLSPGCSGRIIDVDHEGDPVIEFPGVSDSSTFAISRSNMCKSDKPPGVIHKLWVGDTVRIIDESFGWGRVERGDTGRVTGFDDDWDIILQVPSRGVDRWLCKARDVKRVDAGGDTAIDSNGSPDLDALAALAAMLDL